MITCTYCGKENLDGSRFCEACGKPLIVGSHVTGMKGSAAVQQNNMGGNVYNSQYGGMIRYAGFWLRVVASVMDTVIVMIPGLLWYYIVGDQYILPTILPWLYYAYMESSPQQATFGKQAIGLKVTDLAGNRISFGRATGRYFAKYLSSLILCIGYIMVAFTERKQGLHDMIAGCLVVKK